MQPRQFSQVAAEPVRAPLDCNSEWQLAGLMAPVAYFRLIEKGKLCCAVTGTMTLHNNRRSGKTGANKNFMYVLLSDLSLL